MPRPSFTFRRPPPSPAPANQDAEWVDCALAIRAMTDDAIRVGDNEHVLDDLELEIASLPSKLRDITGEDMVGPVSTCLLLPIC